MVVMSPFCIFVIFFTQFEEATGSLPDASLPISNQLEHAIRSIKNHIKTILDVRAENTALQKVNIIAVWCVGYTCERHVKEMPPVCVLMAESLECGFQSWL